MPPSGQVFKRSIINYLACLQENDVSRQKLFKNLRITALSMLLAPLGFLFQHSMFLNLLKYGFLSVTFKKYTIVSTK